MSVIQSQFRKFVSEVSLGYIYLVNAVGTSKFKIGTSQDVSERIKALQIGCPFKIRYVYHVYVKNRISCEMELHRNFSGQRNIGEWFAFTKEDVRSCIQLMRLVQIPELCELSPKVSTKLDCKKFLTYGSNAEHTQLLIEEEAQYLQEQVDKHGECAPSLGEKYAQNSDLHSRIDFDTHSQEWRQILLNGNEEIIKIESYDSPLAALCNTSLYPMGSIVNFAYLETADWYVFRSGKAKGPYTALQLREVQKIKDCTKVRRGEADWQKAGEVSDLAKYLSKN